MITNKWPNIILVGLVFGLSACTLKPSVVLQDTTCSAPCWHQIEIGKTEIDQATNLLMQVPGLDPNSIRRGMNNTTFVEGVSAGFENRKESSIQFFFLERKAVAMTFFYEEDIPLSDAIKKYGEPKYLYPSAIKGDPFVYLTVQLLYPDKGVCLLHEHSGILLKIPETYRITKTTNITRIYYVDPGSINAQIEYGCFRGGDEDELLARQQNWKEYSNYSIP